MQGVIKRLVSDRGFGFIMPDGAKREKQDVFFHLSALSDGTKFEDLKEGDKVEFDTTNSEKGVKAANVRLL